MLTLPRSALISYGLDLLLTFFCSVLAFLIERLPPFQRIIFLDDPSIRYPHSPVETIPPIYLPVVCYVLPLVIVICACLLGKDKRKKVLIGILGLSLAASSTYLVTSILKVFVGKLRPDFLSRCAPSKTSAGASVICTGDPKLILAGRKSMPSGHTSTSFAGLGYAGLIIAGQVRLFDRQGYSYKFFLSILPWISAALVGLSRIRDYRHDVYDVTVGAVIGTLMALLAYQLYFPSLLHDKPDEPYGVRFQKFDASSQIV